MPRLSTPETTTADAVLDGVAADTAGDDAPVAGAGAVVEAATAEAAIAEVHERFGPGATIVEARRVLRGGIGGFFAKEHVQLHVAATPTGVSPATAGSSPGVAGRGPAARAGGSDPSPADRDDIAARAVALAAELTQGSTSQGAHQAPSGSTQDATHLPGAGAGGGRHDAAAGAGGGRHAGATDDGSPVDRLLGGADEEEAETAPGHHAAMVDDTLDFGTFLRTQLARQQAGGATPEARQTTGEVTASASGRVEDATAVRDASDARTAPVTTPAPTSAPERDVQPIRWPGSHTPWSVYGVDATPTPDVEAEVLARGAAVDDAAPTTAGAEVSTTGPGAPTAAAGSAHEVPGDTPLLPGDVPRVTGDVAVSPQGHADTEVAVTTAPVEGPAWSTTRLLHLGLPASLVHHLDVADPTDDLSWVTALTDALRPVCRPLPAGPAVLVGPDAPAIAEVVDLPVARSRTWLDALGANRWRHLVIGGQGWRTELTDEPLAVSWVRTEDLPDALRCATELGLVLGYGPQGGQLRRARPLDVALAVRELVELP